MDPLLPPALEFADGVGGSLRGGWPHTYTAKWTPNDVAFFVDERLIKVVRQSPAYPMQFMLNIYEFADDPGLPSAPDRYPKTFVVERFRGYRPIAGPSARPPAFPAIRAA